jgi:predicted nucleotidyltransferase component of viral defense system
LNAALAFRGGTALHKLHLHPSSRFSEDIDLVQTAGGPIGEVMSALRGVLDPWLGKPRYKQGKGRVTFFYRFDSEIPPIVPMRLKVEINTREHFNVLALHRSPFEMKNPWFSGEVNIPSYALEELLGTELRALYQRKKGRDLFDLWAAYQLAPEVANDEIVRCFNS